MDDENDYKLLLNLNHDPMPPTSGQTQCIMCHETIRFDYYTLTVQEPIFQTIVFDGTCFEQVVAIGAKMHMEVSAAMGTQN